MALAFLHRETATCYIVSVRQLTAFSGSNMASNVVEAGRVLDQAAEVKAIALKLREMFVAPTSDFGTDIPKSIHSVTCTYAAAEEIGFQFSTDIGTGLARFQLKRSEKTVRGTTEKGDVVGELVFYKIFSEDNRSHLNYSVEFDATGAITYHPKTTTLAALEKDAKDATIPRFMPR